MVGEVLRHVAIVAAIGAVGLGAGCAAKQNDTGAPPSAASSGIAATVTPPESVAKAGKLIVCGDASYPPQLFVEGGTTKGYDADIGNAIAATMGVKAELSNVPFSGILAALAADKCDIIVNSFSMTPERLKSVAMTYYGQYGGAFLVSRGNPQGITSLASACGKTAGFGVGTDYEGILTDANSDVCKDNPIVTTGYPTEIAGVTAVSTGKIDTYVTDDTSAAYRVTQAPGIELGGELGNAADMGVVTRLDDQPMTKAVQQSIDELKSDGKLKQIYTTWNLPGVYPNK